MTDKPAISYDIRSYLQGARDAYDARPARQDQPNPLAYASGRVEGEAERLRGEQFEVLAPEAAAPGRRRA